MSSLEASLRSALPADLHGAVPPLARLLSGVVSGQTEVAIAQQTITIDEELKATLRALNGQRVEVGGKLVSFEGAQTGDVKIDVVAGRDVVTVNLTVQQPTPSPALHQLRAPTADFVGREKEIVQLVEAFTRAANSGAAAAITGVRGMGGIGKSELALKVAHELRGAFPDGQLLIELRGATAPLAPEVALQTAIRAFEPSSNPPEEISQLQSVYRSLLAEKRVLVLADDARDAAQVRPLLPPIGCALLVTSRNRFSLPGMSILDLGTLPPEEAKNLVLGICPRSGEYAPEIARLCGYLPLALRVSAGLLATNDDRDVGRYVEQLRQERLRHLKDPDSPDDPQASVEASLGLSYDALDPHGRFVLWQFAILPRGLTSEWLPRVLQSDKDAMDVVQSLYRRNFVQWDAASRGYSLHDLVYEFARARGQIIFEQQTQLYRQRGDLKGTLSALTWLVEFYERGGEVDNAIAGYREMNYLARITGDIRSEVGALDKIGSILGQTGRVVEAIAHHEQALQRAREVDSAEWMESSFLQLIPLYEAAGRLESALRIREARLEEARRRGDRQKELDHLWDLATTFDQLEDAKRAIPLYEQLASLGQQYGDRTRHSYAMGSLWRLYSQQGQYQRAVEPLRTYIDFLRSSVQPDDEGFTMTDIIQQLEDEYSQLLERVRIIPS